MKVNNLIIYGIDGVIMNFLKRKMSIYALRNKLCIYFPAPLFMFIFFNDMYVHGIWKYTRHGVLPLLLRIKNFPRVTS